ncbi:hypothetical protein FOCC_FOCC004742 [Frankliniella occidentalis]|nr:hypothetical protein FOCC_FOCC004742 [Frankliniella occidentalis]
MGWWIQHHRLGVETSAVCSGRAAAADPLGLGVKLRGCEVSTVRAAAQEGEPVQAQAVRAREGAAMLCDGALAGLASTTTGTYSDLRRHVTWITKTLAAPRGGAFLLPPKSEGWSEVRTVLVATRKLESRWGPAFPKMGPDQSVVPISKLFGDLTQGFEFTAIEIH